MIKINRNHAMILLVGGNFMTAVCFALQAPFFPREAQSKGLSTTQIGFVFGIYEFLAIILSPLTSKLINKAKVETLIALGLLIEGLAVIAFGFLNISPGGQVFFILALIIRWFEAFGSILFAVVNFTAAAALFPNATATLFGILYTGFSIGQICGPTIGALFYNVGGFRLPFLALGACLCGSAVLTYVVLRLANLDNGSSNNSTLIDEETNKQKDVEEQQKSTKNTDNNQSNANDKQITTKTKRATGIWQLISSFSCLLDLTSLIIAYAFIGFNAATLEPFLRQFHLTVLAIGFVFIVDGAALGICMPFAGKLCDHGFEPKILIIIGHIVGIVGICLIGPIPVLPLSSSMPLVVTGLALFGFSVGLKYVPAFQSILKEAVELRNFEEGKNTQALVTSVMFSTGALGSSIGPTIGGYLYEQFDYQITSLVFVVVELVLLIFAMMFYCSTGKRSLCFSKQSESQTKSITKYEIDNNV